MSKNALPYYPRFPRDFLEGTAGMSLELKGAYGIVIDLIYMSGSRGLPDDSQYVAGQLGTSVRKWNSLRKTLIDMGKIYADNGIISNKRADKVKINQSKYQDNQAENASGPSKNKGLAKPAPTDREEPKPEPKEVDKSTSSQVAADYQKFMEEHPKPIESRAGEVAFAALIAAGEKPEMIIAAAKGYAETVKGWSVDAKVQQSDNFLDADRGKWRGFIPKPKVVPMTAKQRLEFIAVQINSGGFVASSSIRPDQAREMLAANLVTPAQLAQRGIQA